MLLVANARDAFRAFLTVEGLSLQTMTLAQGVAASVAFYRVQRFDDAEFEGDGDMLLLQWGPRSWEGERFTVDMTRQLMSGDGEDDNLFQLHLVFFYAPPVAIPMSDSGWCAGVESLPAFEEFLRGSPVLREFGDKVPLSVGLTYDCAG